ncbi:helix-turn-helix domain-containing protein [Bacteroides ndongoniae]|uniref:helix-turn-helix domain-containing protein n=1 Tax=Bacteroides ndongoniae TaxID=1903262 RepID=UPI0009F27E84|nr:helix-turn-helix domain-containing protein [Bacteroides ndongoniae]
MYLEKETIATVDIDYFRKYKEEMDEDYVDYVDENVVVARNIDNLPESNQMIRLNLFIIVTCIEGKLQLSVNGKGYQLQTGEAFICLPTMILSDMLVSSRHKISMIGFSTKFMQQTMKRGKAAEKALYYIYKNPVFAQVTDKNTKGIHNIGLYNELIMDKIGDTSHPYRQEILGHLFSALLHEMLAGIQKHSDTIEETGIKADRSKRIFRQFMKEVSEDGGIHRSVSHYADRLCYSPKYISSAIKEVSGRTPTEWINEYAIEQIKYQLRQSDMSVKEIAEMFNFPNQSFFGKYVKAHVGMSPARYRAYSNGKEQSDSQTAS